jgi:bifunctional non-homologous end joining protein LigD
MFNPMKCNDHAELLGSPDYVLQRKYDGTRCIVTKKGDKITMIGRSAKSDYASNYPEIVAEIRRLDDGVYDSELTFFIKNTTTDVFLTALAKTTKEKYDVALMFFDVMEREGIDVKNYVIELRLGILNQVFQIAESKKPFKYIRTVKTVFDHTTHKAIYDGIIARGGEGVVLKRKGSFYVEDSRREWVKAKKEITVDCVVVGMTKGNGAREPYFGALILAQYDDNGVLRHVCNCSGFNVETMKELKAKIMGAKVGNIDFKIKDVVRYIEPTIVVEVKCFAKTEDGSLRFPAFVRVRTDKQPAECKINQ